MKRRISLGLDLSTQSITAAAVDVESGETLYRKSLDYRKDPRLDRFGLNHDYLLPPSEPGEAVQPAAIFAAAIDAVLEDIRNEWPGLGLSPADIKVINHSAQQHAHVMLSREAPKVFESLRHANEDHGDKLADRIEPALALEFARIWRTSNTSKQADLVRERVGGSKKLMALTGSDAPLRFSAFGIRKTAEENPGAYSRTSMIHQLNSFVAGL
ncbi:MAG: xylulose kinase, partial [Planctomycetes bacterium]|nr:xylulose kinase [Planctomycetota bacterium]